MQPVRPGVCNLLSSDNTFRSSRVRGTVFEYESRVVLLIGIKVRSDIIERLL